LAILHPAPVGLPGEEEPEGFAHGSGEVGDGGVGGEDEVEMLEDGGGVGEVAIVGAGVQKGNRRADFGWNLLDFAGGGAFLEGDPVDLGDLEEREEGMEGGGAFAVGAVVGVSGPVEADFEDLRVPASIQERDRGWGARIGPIRGGGQVGDGCGDGFEGGLEEGGEAHQRDLVGEGRDGVALGEDLDGRSGSFASHPHGRRPVLGEAGWLRRIDGTPTMD